MVRFNKRVALLAEGVDRNISVSVCSIHAVLSPSSRRAWIEIEISVIVSLICQVALLAEGVDRNRYRNEENTGGTVALLAEGVDRNIFSGYYRDAVFVVALLAEGVDRNFTALSSFPGRVVALLAEGVDRNTKSFEEHGYVIGRPPRGGRG